MSIIEIVKERLHIEDIVGRDVPLTKTGKNLRALCPFHNEQTPSFFVFPDSQRYKCFGCGASGDLFDFVMQREGWDMDTALRELAAQAEVILSPQSAEEKRRLFLQREKETVFAVATEYCHQALGLARSESPESGSPGLDYARRLRFTDEQDQDRRYIVCHNEKQAEKDRHPPDDLRKLQHRRNCPPRHPLPQFLDVPPAGGCGIPLPAPPPRRGGCCGGAPGGGPSRSKRSSSRRSRTSDDGDRIRRR